MLNEYLKKCYYECSGYNDSCDNYRPSRNYDIDLCVWSISAMNEMAKLEEGIISYGTLEDLPIMDSAIHKKDTIEEI